MFSTTTATTIRGLAAGAKHTNHARGFPVLVCAVPVFPATWIPGIWAAVPSELLPALSCPFAGSLQAFGQ